MTLVMTEYEIRQMYKLAKDKKEQIQILADLNKCSVEVIRKLLVGFDLPREKRNLTNDFKKQIAEEYLRGGISQMKRAKKHDITQTTVKNIMRDYRKGRIHNER